MANPSVFGALSRIKQLADQNPSLTHTFQVLLRAEHKVALDTLLQEPHTDTAVRALTKMGALVFWLHTIGHGPTQEVSQRMLDDAEAGARTAAETRLQAANAAVEAAAAEFAARLKAVQDELSEARLGLASAQAQSDAAEQRASSAEQRASSAEAEVRTSQAVVEELVNQADGLLQDAGDETRQAQRAAEAVLKALDEAEERLAAGVLGALCPASPPELSASPVELSLSPQEPPQDQEADADGHPCQDDTPTPPLVPEGPGVGPLPRCPVSTPTWPTEWGERLSPQERAENERILDDMAKNMGVESYKDFLCTEGGAGPITVDAIKRGAPVFGIGLPAEVFNSYVQDVEKDGAYVIFNPKTQVWIAVVYRAKKGRNAAAFQFVVSHYTPGEEGKPGASVEAIMDHGASSNPLRIDPARMMVVHCYLGVAPPPHPTAAPAAHAAHAAHATATHCATRVHAPAGAHATHIPCHALAYRCMSPSRRGRCMRRP